MSLLFVEKVKLQVIFRASLQSLWCGDYFRVRLRSDPPQTLKMLQKRFLLLLSHPLNGFYKHIKGVMELTKSLCCACHRTKRFIIIIIVDNFVLSILNRLVRHTCTFFFLETTLLHRPFLRSHPFVTGVYVCRTRF